MTIELAKARNGEVSGGKPPSGRAVAARRFASRQRRPNPVFGDEYAEIRSVLVAARLEAGLTQRTLAAHLGKSPSHVARIEAGQRRVDSLELYLFAKCLGLEPTELFARLATKLDQVAMSAAPAPGPANGRREHDMASPLERRG